MMCAPPNPEVRATVVLAHKTPRGFVTAGVDPCIAPLVQALNHGGLQTIASCCGHGHRPGRISLEDGREILVLPDYEAAHSWEGGGVMEDLIERLEKRKAIIEKDIAEYPRWGAYLTAKAEELRGVERHIAALRAREASDD